MKSNDSLLKLEKKLGICSEKEMTMAKFICKPSMKIDSFLNKKGLNDFLEEFKQSTRQVQENRSKYNIEGGSDDEIDEDHLKKHKGKAHKEGQIELDLALGVLEDKEPKNLEMNDIIPKDNDDNEEDDEDKGAKELLEFIINK